MDINYLLLLQNFREATNNFFSPFLMAISNFAIYFWPYAIAAMIFWVSDRKAGRRIFAGFGLGVCANGILKLTFRIPRPWIRDARVLPFGDSKLTATGYSFPSGHSTYATALLGGSALWARKRNKLIAVLLSIVVLLVLFSRNYLGVHTPQDVLVGFSCTALLMFVSSKIEDWTDENPKRDLYVLIAGLALCIAFGIWANCTNIQPVYDDTGKMVVVPAKMIADSFEGIGFLSAFVVCRYFERRLFNFDKEINWKNRFIIGVFALIPLYFWMMNILHLVEPLSRSLGKYLTQAGFVVYVMIIVPFVMSKIRIKD